MYRFNPTSDMFETSDSIVIQIELAGVSKEDIEIEFSGNGIEVSGIKRRKEFAGRDNFQRMERPFGVFRRFFDLPRAIDAEGVGAFFNEGLLEVIIPKRNRNGSGFKIMSIEIKGE